MDNVEILANYSNLKAAGVPFWMVALVVAACLPAATIAGYWSGKRALRRANRTGSKEGLPAQGDTTLGAMLGLLGLVLAFTYAFALSRADARKVALVEEAAAIGTAFLRADLLAEPGRSELQDALLRYARTRYVEPADTASQEKLRAVIARSLEAQSALWPTAMRSVGTDTPAPIAALIANGVTEVLDAHARRISAISERIPAVVTVLLLFAAMVAMAIAGSHAAFRNRPISWRLLSFGLMLSGVIIVIVDFERASEGLIRTNTDAIRSAIADMEAARAAASGNVKS